MSMSRYRMRIMYKMHWKKCWDQDPEHMELVRQKGVSAMQHTWKERNENLGKALAPWPRKMRKPEFKERVQALIDSPQNLRTRRNSPHQIQSMIDRLKINGFVKYNKKKKVWVNLCYQSNYAEGNSEDTPNPAKESFTDQS